jgi:hypothetical protein
MKAEPGDGTVIIQLPGRLIRVSMDHPFIIKHSKVKYSGSNILNRNEFALEFTVLWTGKLVLCCYTQFHIFKFPVGKRHHFI